MPLRDWLRLSRGRLVADLHPDDVIDQLTGPGLISADEESEIDRLDSREAKARRLIRLIDLRDSEALLAAFHAALRSDYHWLTLPEPSQPAGAEWSRPMHADAGVGVDGGAIVVPPLVACARPIGSVPGVEGGGAAWSRPIGSVPGVEDGGAAWSRPMGSVDAWLDGAPAVPALVASSRPMGAAAATPGVGSAPGESADFGAPPSWIQPQPVTHAHLDQVASNALALDSWRGIARDLGVTEDDIASVQSRLPLDARAQCYEILRLWSLDYEGACLAVLVAALRKNRLNRLAARVMM